MGVYPNNEKIYYIVDAINDAINQKKKVSFYYFDFLPNKKKRIKNDGNPYIVSPYSLAWNGDYYYLIGYSDEREKRFRPDDNEPCCC